MYIFLLFSNTNLEVIVLTNINCSENCIYQKDGKCSLENINGRKVTSWNDCAYFIDNNKSLSSLKSK